LAYWIQIAFSNVNQRISDYSFIEIKSGNKYEIAVVKSIDNTSFPTEITLSVARLTSTTTFGIGAEVYGIKNEIVSGLEDDLYLAISNQTYNLTSENNSNILGDYSEINVSEKVINIIQSYIPYINRKTWLKY
jgi:hypothetical protein